MTKALGRRTSRSVLSLAGIGLVAVWLSTGNTSGGPRGGPYFLVNDPGRRVKGAVAKKNATFGMKNNETFISPDGNSIRPNLTDYDKTIWWQGFRTMNRLVKRSWSGNALCDEVARGNYTNKKVLVKIKFPCQRQFAESSLGTGNIVTATYALRLVAQVLGMDVDLVCTQDGNERTSLAANVITPWLTGFFPADGPRPHRELPQPPLLSLKKACSNKPLQFLLPEIRYEFRRLAVALVGGPRQGQLDPALEPYYLVPVPPDPMLPGVQLDDVVTHFRCGDSLITTVPGYEFNRFDAVVSEMPPHPTSIGILTQPFQVTEQVRKYDRLVNLDHCRWLVGEFVDYLQERFPEAQIHIHNGPNETTALAMARMVLAQHVVTGGLSTFSIFPAMASLGTALIRKPTRGAPNYWLWNHPPLETLADNLLVKDELSDRIAGPQLTEIWDEPNGPERIRAWFRGERETL